MNTSISSVAGRLFVASALTLTVAPIAASPEVIEQILVKVNGDIITKTDLEQRQIAALRRSNIDPNVLKNEEQLKQAIAKVTPEILVETIDEMLQVQLGREKGLKLSDENFNRWLTNLRKENNLIDEQKFQAALKQEGMTIADLRRNVEKSFLLTEVQRSEIGSKLQITEEEAKQYYQSHQQEFVTPATVTLREIFIEGADGAAAEEKASATRERLASGEDFGKVASEVSSAASKANGGLIGPLQLADLSQSLQDTLKKMKPGDITQPIKTAKGYQILKLETMAQSTVQPFDSVRDVVAEKVYGSRQRIELQRFLSRIRNQAIIEWKNEELKKAWEQQIALEKSSVGTPSTSGTPH
jgi:peptidyl-prolyl cis-trans isomerase SurA